MVGPVDVFISYAKADEDRCRELESHLAGLRQDGVLRTWSRRHVAAGDDWKNAVAAHLDQAGLVLLLVSADYLASDELYEVQAMTALARARDGHARAIPVLLHACDWSIAAFAGLSPLPSNGVPVSSWPNRNEAWFAVARGIREALAARRVILGDASVEARATHAAPAARAPDLRVHLRVVGTPYAYQAPPGLQLLSLGRQRRKLGGSIEEGNDIVVRVTGDDARTLRISRRHLEIVRAATHWSLVDRSRGRTTLNDAPIPAGEPVPLRSGDRIGLAGVLLVEFSLGEASSDAVVAGPVNIAGKDGAARGVVLETSVGDMVTVRDDD